MKRFLLFTSLLLAACTGGADAPSDKLRQLSNGPELPAECDICWVDFQLCADSGQDIEACEDLVVSCAQLCEAPPPPLECDHCFAGYDACVEEAGLGMQDAADCVAGLESCLVSCEEPLYCDTIDGGWGDDCPPPPPMGCENQCADKCSDIGIPEGDAIPPANACYEECIQECSEPCVEVCWDCPASPDGTTGDCEPGCETICDPPPPPPECYDQCWECPPGLDGCVSGCETICDPPPPPPECYEECWICADGDLDCEPGCVTVCEPTCTGGCTTSCDEQGNCDTACWEDFCDGGGGDPMPLPEPSPEPT